MSPSTVARQCRSCGAEVLLLPRHDDRWTVFEPQDFPLGEVHPADAWVFVRGRGATPVAIVAVRPERVLMLHYCRRVDRFRPVDPVSEYDVRAAVGLEKGKGRP